ncbi:MAG: response regulator [Leptolyngbya sp. DLM2.Bin27]|nr:MAG: response regulator [Leptolyngbya sp. DLM2.Bin27]
MRILLVEDDSLAGELLVSHLKKRCYTVDLAIDGQVGFELANQWSYNLIVLDVQLPKLDGLSVCRQLRGQGCETPILMLTARDASDDVVTGLDAGADDYVTKPCDPAQLTARIRSLLRRGQQPLSLPTLCWGDLSLHLDSAEVFYQTTKVPLTAKEYTLLAYFLRHPQRVFSRCALIDRLWPMDESPSDATVTNLVKDLRRKLKNAGLVEDVIETVYGLGYRLEAAPPTSQLQDEDTSRLEPTAEQVIFERFRASLGERIAQVDGALAAFQSGALGVQQRQNAITEAHQLAGTLGMFGANPATDLMKTIEQLLMCAERGEAQLAQAGQLRVALQDVPSAFQCPPWP